jgi:DNA replicative helicase MCM subunit Mcm2 (Cdc46/Mcm family)
LTTGVGTTSAGLTCAAVREGSGGEFALEAGALVLADKGVCCIDEFGCIRESDRTTIHEAMEQQTLSVAKAGIVCKLNCRATIIAVMNPRDCLYDNHASLSMNTGLGTPLLSRFDLIFKFVDSSDAERDSNVTTYLLNRAIQGAGFDVTETNDDENEASERPWSMEKLRAYIAIVKESFQPVMSDSAAMLLERHYEKCRASQSNTIPVTVRFLESLIRLSQAHARLMHRDSSNAVTLQDAVAVIHIMECTAFAYGGFDGVGVNDIQNVMYRDPMSIDFSDEPDLDLLFFEYRILERYGMLDVMDNDRRNQALVALGGTAGSRPSSGGWQDVESNQYNSINAPFQQEASSGWSAPDSGFHGNWSQHNSETNVTQDHYGRYHFGSPPSNQKRPRF